MMPAWTATIDPPNSLPAMHHDDRDALPELGPEEVGARVSAILEAAERDAREVIEAAYRERAQQPPRAPEELAVDVAERQPPRGLEELAVEVALLAARVDALEQALGGDPAAPAENAARRAADAGTAAARVRAVELALAGLSRDAIAQELSGIVAPDEVELLLDDVLSD